jgi:hypothetical protein
MKATQVGSIPSRIESSKPPLSPMEGVEVALAIEAALAAHPSRKLPKCRDCAHVHATQTTSWCNHPSFEVHLVTGHPVHTCEHMRFTTCRPEGVLFERRVYPSALPGSPVVYQPS